MVSIRLLKYKLLFVFLVSPKDLVTVTPANNITFDRGDDHTLMCQTPAGSNNQFIWLKQGQEEACQQGGQQAEVNGKLLNFIIFS